MMEASQYHGSFQKWFILVLYFENQRCCYKLNFLHSGEISKMNFPGEVGSKQYQNLNLSSVPYTVSLKNPHELRWILIMIPAHTENLCEVKKKKIPQRDLQFPQSPVNLNISTK